MQLSITEFDELTQMRENIRRSIEALELCWSCQCISECEPAPVDDGPPVWLCAACNAKMRSQQVMEPAHRTWPFGA
jgi:hypothetical protein